jgi:hypothetical protein
VAGYKGGVEGVGSKVHPKGSYERRRVYGRERVAGRRVECERARRREFTSLGEFLQDLISRARASARA